MSSTSDGAQQPPAPTEHVASGSAPGGPVERDGMVAGAPADMRVVAVRDVVKTYPTHAARVVALDGVSLDVAGRGLHVVAGVAGAGITTLLGLIACLDRPDAGQVWVAGVDTVTASRAARRDLRRRAIGIVHPSPATNLLPALPAGGNVAWAARRRTGAVLNATGIDAHLDMVGLAGAGRARVSDLSGGDRQRLALACALVGEPRLVVADDPTVTLDREGATRFVNALRDAADRGACVLAGTSDPLVVEAADSVSRLDAGRIVS